MCYTSAHFYSIGLIRIECVRVQFGVEFSSDNVKIELLGHIFGTVIVNDRNVQLVAVVGVVCREWQ